MIPAYLIAALITAPGPTAPASTDYDTVLLDNPGEYANQFVSDRSVELSRLGAENKAKFAMSAPDWTDGVGSVRPAPGRYAPAPRQNLRDKPSPAGFAELQPWPNGEIPFTFTDVIINSFFGVPNSPDEANAAAAYPATLAVMLAIEENFRDPATGDLLIKFVGYDPAIHDRVLIVQSTGLDPDLVIPPDLTGGTQGGCFHTMVIGAPQAGTLGAVANAGQSAMTLCTWTNFGSIAQGLGFVLGLDWEQLRPDQAANITVFPERIIPTVDANQGNFPIAPGSVVQLDTQLAGQSFFNIDNTIGQEVGSYDFLSLMHIDRFSLSVDGRPVFDIVQSKRFIDLDGNGSLEADLHDLVGTASFFSEGDEATIQFLYNLDLSDDWAFGDNPDCPVDVNNDGTQNDADFDLFFEYWQSGRLAADVNGDGNVDATDLDVFLGVFEPTTDNGCEFPWFFGKNTTCPADVNEDGTQDELDVQIFLTLWQARSSAADTDFDGDVDIDDLTLFNSTFTTTGFGDCNTTFDWDPDSSCPVDVNLDGQQTPEDLTLFVSLWLNRDPVTDLNDDGEVNYDDLLLFYQALSNTGFGFCDDTGVNPPIINNPDVRRRRLNDT